MLAFASMLSCFLSFSAGSPFSTLCKHTHTYDNDDYDDDDDDDNNIDNDNDNEE
jgi:hypothetical protein